MAAVVATGWLGVPGATVEPAWFTLHVPLTQLALNHVGEVRDEPGELEVRDRDYSASGTFRVTINGSDMVAHRIGIVSNLRVRSGTGEHQGAIALDIANDPGGHLALEYRGLVTPHGSTIWSAGAFKVVRATGAFAGLRPEGNYGVVIEGLDGPLGSTANVIFAAVAQ